LVDFNLPHLHYAPSLGVTQSNFNKVFGTRKLESMGYRAAPFAWCALAALMEHRLLNGHSAAVAYITLA